MFIIKKKYYFYIDNTKSINLNSIKKNSKIIIIYRNQSNNESIENILKFKKNCKRLKIKFFISNNIYLARKIRADGLYVSSYNQKIYKNINVIGSAHNYKEINHKIKQGCRTIILSRLFKTAYKNKKSYYGILKFNLIFQQYGLNLIPLGGINNKNLLKINLIKSDGFGILSSVKKKPAIANRLF